MLAADAEYEVNNLIARRLAEMTETSEMLAKSEDLAEMLQG